jgi:uncharacterized SAM-binding protein YcdF (DUF218 family)
VLILLAGAALCFLVATARLFVWPTTNGVDRADAVVVLDGGSGERIAEARALMAGGVAPVLVISVGRELDDDEAAGPCAPRQEFEVVCFSPTPATTRGEARGLATLARRHGWDHVALVTSTFHVSRARLLVSRCFDGRLDVVGADPPRNPLHWAAAVAHEWGGTIEATLRRTC